MITMLIDWREIRYDSLLFLFGVFCLLGAFSPWEAAENALYNALGVWQGKFAFIGSWCIITAGLTELEFIVKISKYRPYSGSLLGFLGSVFVLIGSISFYFNGTLGASHTWGIYLSIIFGFGSLFLSIMNYIEYREGGEVFRAGGGLPSE